jgi:hypothetical protein
MQFLTHKYDGFYCDGISYISVHFLSYSADLRRHALIQYLLPDIFIILFTEPCNTSVYLEI